MIKSNSKLGKVALLSTALISGLAGIASAEENKFVAEEKFQKETPVADKLVFDFNVNSDLSGFGMNVEGRHDFNDKLGIGLGLGFGIVPGLGFGIGNYAEFKIGSFSFIGGGKLWSYDAMSLFGGLVCELPVNEQLSFRINGGYDTERKFYAGLGFTVQENKRGLKNPKTRQW